MTFGEFRRTKPRINIKRGFAGNEPQSITLAAAPATFDGTIKSGMLIVLDTDGKWVPSSSSDTKNTVPYFAYSDDSDTDVKSSQRLLGLSCLGEFEIQTGYFDSDTYAVGDPLVKSATAGNVAKGGSFLSAVEVVGIVSQGAKQDVTKTNSEASPVGGPVSVLNLIPRWKPAQS
jgi:hypothetical protein